MGYNTWLNMQQKNEKKKKGKNKVMKICTPALLII